MVLDNVRPVASLPADDQTPRLGREDWITAAIEVFTESGIDAVRVERLAARLNVTKGSFYWHFKNRKELHQAIINHWSRRCTTALTDSVLAGDDIIGVVLALFEIWLREEPFSPKLDAAMRDWARRSSNVQQAVEEADATRTAAIAAAFQRAAYPEREALIRARILYFMQIGYYETHLQESFAVRMDYTREYIRGFTGLELSAEREEEYRRRFLP